MVSGNHCDNCSSILELDIAYKLSAITYLHNHCTKTTHLEIKYASSEPDSTNDCIKVCQQEKRRAIDKRVLPCNFSNSCTFRFTPNLMHYVNSPIRDSTRTKDDKSVSLRVRMQRILLYIHKKKTKK